MTAPATSSSCSAATFSRRRPAGAARARRSADGGDRQPAPRPRRSRRAAARQRRRRAHCAAARRLARPAHAARVDQGDGVRTARSRVAWTPEQLAEGLATIDSETDRLNRLVGNLLDASRLQTGAAGGRRSSDRHGRDRRVRGRQHRRVGRAVVFDLADDLPLVAADPALLERAIANLVERDPLQHRRGAGADRR